MRLLVFIAAVVALFALNDPSIAQSRSSSRYSPAYAADPPPTAKSAGLRLLTWPGKVTPQANAASPPSQPQVQAQIQAQAAAAPAIARQAPAQRPALPTSIYAPAPPA